MHLAVKGGARAGALLVVAVIVAVAWQQASRSSELPPWFGDQYRAPMRIAGTVFGATGAMKVKLFADAPDPFIWSGAEVTSAANGDFDFGPMRAGRYLVLASGNGLLSRAAVVDTLRGVGDEVELFAYDWEALDARLYKVDHDIIADDDWRLARELTAPKRTWDDSMRSTIDGTVLRADGTPAAFVGVVPMSLPTGDHSRPHELGIVATTDAAGHFRVRDDELSGFRILLGPRMHETWVDQRYGPGRSQQLTITLPPSGDEQHDVFIRERRDFGDPQGAWIRGHVVRAGRPVADVRVTFTTGGNMPLDDSTRSRNDGSFELYISAREIDHCQPIVLYAGDNARRLAGLAVIEVVPGQTVEGATVEVGAGVHVTGTVVDEAGQPVQGVRINEIWRGLKSTPTDRDGRFELAIYHQGRYRLRVLDDADFELLPPDGRLSPTIDIAIPDGSRDDVLVMVRRDAKVRRERSSWVGFDGYIDLGASIGREDVRAVDNELEAAGLRAGDTIVATDPPRESYGFWSAQMILEGEQTTLTVLRDGKQLDIHATAPYFGPREPRRCPR